MLDVAQGYLFVFGVLAIAGGVLGFVRAKSRASLIAGGLSGALVVIAGALIAAGRARPGCILGLVVSIALAGRFVPAFLKTRKPMPAGVMALFAVGGIAVTAAALAAS